VLLLGLDRVDLDLLRQGGELDLEGVVLALTGGGQHGDVGGRGDDVTDVAVHKSLTHSTNS